MSIKKLSFKGDTNKKRKRTTKSTTKTLTTSNDSPSSKSTASTIEAGWIDAESLEDIDGPIMVAYSYDTPVSLTSDARGSVFTIALDPVPASLSLAEPHDVRQVFIASPILSRPPGVVSLKNGATNKYMGTDRIGDVRCERDAIGPSDEWTMVKRPDGWSIGSIYDTYMSISEGGSVRCDVQEIGFCETFRIRIQAQNKAKRVKVGSIVGASGKGLGVLSRKELEEKCGRPLTLEEVDALRDAQKRGELGEAVLDMRVKGRSDKFG